jgi:hypothetical protein
MHLSPCDHGSIGKGRSGFPFAFYEVVVRGHTEEIGGHTDDVPEHDGSRCNQQAVVNPENLEYAHNRCHPRVHALAGASFQHCDQVRSSGKGRSKARDNADDLRALKMGDQQARGVLYRQFPATREDNRADEAEPQRKSHGNIRICLPT